MPAIPPEVLGPLGLTIAACIVAVVLWRAHETSDRDMKADRDYWRSIALTGVDVADKSTTIAVRKQ